MRFTRHLEVLPAFELFFKKIDQVLKFLSVFLAISGIFALSVLFFCPLSRQQIIMPKTA